MTDRDSQRRWRVAPNVEGLATALALVLDQIEDIERRLIQIEKDICEISMDADKFARREVRS